MQATRSQLAAHLARLDAHLDTVTLEATLGLMLAECRAEIRRLRGRIALASLDGRPADANEAAHLETQQALEADLVAARARALDRSDLLGVDDAPVPLGSPSTVVSLRNGRS